jgi:hypothetical protein
MRTMDSRPHPASAGPRNVNSLRVRARDYNQNLVVHETFNFQGTNVLDPTQALNMHVNFDRTTNANGTVTAFHANVSCS